MTPEEHYPLIAGALREGRQITADMDADDSAPIYQLNGEWIGGSDPLLSELEKAEHDNCLKWELTNHLSWHWWARLVGFESDSGIGAMFNADA